MRNQPITMPSCWRARVVCWITVSSFSLFCAPPPPPSDPLGGASMLSMSVKSSIPSWPLTTVASTNTDHMAALFKQVSITAMFSVFHHNCPQCPPIIFRSLEFLHSKLVVDTWRNVEGWCVPIMFFLPAPAPSADKGWQWTCKAFYILQATLPAGRNSEKF